MLCFRYTGLMGIETDTNPIDRTIAHLLFHRPSDSSNMSNHLPLKLNTKVRSDSYIGDPFTCELVDMAYVFISDGSNQIN